jgi:predicted PurR-regulated permease PerM
LTKIELTQNKLIAIFLIIIGFIGIYLLSSVLTPFLIAAFLAYLVNPLVNKLVKFKLTRPISVAIVSFILFAMIILLFVLVIPFIQKQVNIFIEKIPDMLVSLQVFLDSITNYLELNNIEFDTQTIRNFIVEHWSKANSFLNWILISLFHSGLRIFEFFMNLFLIPIVTLYLLADWPELINTFQKTLPQRIRPTIIHLSAECDVVLSAFLRGQFLVMLVLSVLYSTGLSLIGLQMGLLIGLAAGLLSFVPYLGLIVGVAIASLTAFLQFHAFTPILLVWLIFFLGQTLDHVFLTPKLVGNRIGLHPVAVIFAILAGGKLFGFIGILIALPVAAMVMVWIRHFYSALTV